MLDHLSNGRLEIGVGRGVSPYELNFHKIDHDESREIFFDAYDCLKEALTNDEFWMITGPAGAGTLVTFGPDPRANAAAARVVEQDRDRGFEPSGYTLHTYAAVQAWAQAVEKAGSLDLDAVIASLRSHAFETVLGEIGFDDKGDVTAPGYVWYVWNNGAYVPLE